MARMPRYLYFQVYQQTCSSLAVLKMLLKRKLKRN